VTATTAAAAAPRKTRGYNFAYLDEGSKRMIRRAILKAIAIPGYQVPFAAREMPVPPGWGTGGMQVTCSLIGPGDIVKVIDQGADEATNASCLRLFFAQVANVGTTTDTGEATIIQTRHRIPETPLRGDQIIVFQVPEPEPLRDLEPREPTTRILHGLNDYSLIYVQLYEMILRYGGSSTTSNYPVVVGGHYLSSPSPIPQFDNPKLDGSPYLKLFGAGREKRIYAIPPYTPVASVAFEDYPFQARRRESTCSRCGATDSYLDEIIIDDLGNRRFVCSDSSYCRNRHRENSPARQAVAGATNEPR
jgi:alpha-D-ribose 1-methylphosphonate 5-phosphate C-P lyase